MKKIEITVGVFVAIGLAALFMLAMQVSSIGNFSNSGSYYVKASFDQIGGLKVRAPVTIAGVKVGKVADISLSSADYSAVVTIALDSKLLPMQKHNGEFEAVFDNKTGKPQICHKSDDKCATPLFEDATASILTAGLLGEQYIGLSAGGGSPNLLEVNDFISISQSAIGLEQIIGQMLFGSTDSKKPVEEEK